MTAPELTTEALDLRPCAADDLDVLFALWTDPASIRVLEKLGMRRTRRRISNERPIFDYEIQNLRLHPYG